MQNRKHLIPKIHISATTSELYTQFSCSVIPANLFHESTEHTVVNHFTNCNFVIKFMVLRTGGCESEVCDMPCLVGSQKYDHATTQGKQQKKCVFLYYFL